MAPPEIKQQALLPNDPIMSEPSSILRQYEAIAGITRRMLVEARANNWDQVVMLGRDYQQAVEALRGIDTLSTEDRQARLALLTQILDDDARIRHLAAPELTRLGALLGDMKRQHTVLQAYCTPTLTL